MCIGSFCIYCTLLQHQCYFVSVCLSEWFVHCWKCYSLVVYFSLLLKQCLFALSAPRLGGDMYTQTHNCHLLLLNGSLYYYVLHIFVSFGLTLCFVYVWVLLVTFIFTWYRDQTVSYLPPRCYAIELYPWPLDHFCFSFTWYIFPTTSFWFCVGILFYFILCVL